MVPLVPFGTFLYIVGFVFDFDFVFVVVVGIDFVFDVDVGFAIRCWGEANHPTI